MGKVEVSRYLVQGVRIACENSISSVTLSGDLDILENIMTTIKQQHPDVLVRLLRVEMAYHSRESCLNSRWTWAKKHRSLFMTVVGELYYKFIAKHLSPRSPKIPFYSSVQPKVLHEASDFGPKYWQDNLESPVLSHSAIQTLLAGSKECSVHLEVGPHAALRGPLR